MEYLGKSDGKWLGVPVAYINEAVSPRWLLHARRRLQVAQNTNSLKRISASAAEGAAVVPKRCRLGLRPTATDSRGETRLVAAALTSN